MTRQYYVCALLSVMLLGGCSSSAVYSPPSSQYEKPLTESQRNTTQALYQQHKSWRGTPYRLGGNGRKGIDCSAFTQITFAELFQQQLPRTTRQQQYSGNQISRSELQPGDLVFFKTGFKDRHVGIYIRSQEFLHASTSAGVTISRLDNPYWRKTYWKAIRPD